MDLASNSIFNYKAGIATVLIHAGYVVFEIVPAIWIARQFGRSIQAQSLVMEHLGSAAEEIDSATTQVSASSNSLAQGATEQAASIEETSAAAEMIKTASLRNAKVSSEAAHVAGESAQRAEQTRDSLELMIEAMDRIGSSSEKISQIVKVIDQIAFQTNILALNAAVEAARAGEAGLGFAVVAEEVRTLAQRSADAAKQTESLISESIENARLGVAKVNEVADSVRGITRGSSDLKSLVQEIKVASEEQCRGIDQVATSIQRMESVTQSNAANAEETAAAAEQLAAQSKAMRDVVNQLAALAGKANEQPATPKKARTVATLAGDQEAFGFPLEEFSLTY